VDVLDAASFAASSLYDTGLAATWGSGDFNNDGHADILALSDMLSGGLFDAGPYLISGAVIAPVPEPTSLGVAAAVGLVLVACAGRQRRGR